MRLKSATLHGLWGVYSASGKKEIYIDFTKCIHNIVLIIGKNGSGKTTIWEALQPIPLPASKFIDKEPGFIHLEYIHDDLIYKIRMEYPITNSRDRAQTKVFITRISDSDMIELNPNGNINSYKSILYSEFNLDPSFVSLSQISQEDMGIVNKKPSERKKYVSSITDDIEVYNGIYKSLVKRSGIFRSMINSITAKMDTIGNQESLMTDLTSKEVILDRLLTEKDYLTRKKIELEKEISVMDPDGKIQERYQQLTSQILEYKKELNNLIIFIKSAKNRYRSDDAEILGEKVVSLRTKIARSETQVSALEDALFKMHEERNSLGIEINEKVQKASSIRNEYDHQRLKTEMELLKTKIDAYKKSIHDMGFIDLSSVITKDEFVSGLNILSFIKDKISKTKSLASSEESLLAVLSNLNNNGIGVESEIENIRNDLETTIHLIQSGEQKIVEYSSYKSLSEKLKDRPEGCNISGCFFIKDALEAEEKCNAFNLDETRSIVERNKELKNKLSKHLNFLYEQYDIEKSIKDIVEYIKGNSYILSKFPTCTSLLNISTFLENFCSSLFIDTISSLVENMNSANIFEDYKSLSSRLLDLERDEKIYADKEETAAKLDTEIAILEGKSDKLVKDIVDTQDSVMNYKKQIQDSLSTIKGIEESILMINKYNEYEEKISSIDAELLKIEGDIKTIGESVVGINEISSRLAAIESDLRPISADKDQLRFALKQLEEYKEELVMYTEKYNTVELIKKYSSPTKAGIQTLFMQLYMGKTISMTNELLSSLFDGRMELEPYIINDNEFRIPCINKESNVYHDDISSCSSAERAMISMMIGFSLLYHSSTTYNILRMDEIDGALDQNNRSEFIGLLNSFMGKFGIEQCITISHSSEISMGEVDIIELTPVMKAKGNVIFTYE